MKENKFAVHVIRFSIIRAGRLKPLSKHRGKHGLRVSALNASKAMRGLS